MKQHPPSQTRRTRYATTAFFGEHPGLEEARREALALYARDGGLCEVPQLAVLLDSPAAACAAFANALAPATPGTPQQNDAIACTVRGVHFHESARRDDHPSSVEVSLRIGRPLRDFSRDVRERIDQSFNGMGLTRLDHRASVFLDLKVSLTNPPPNGRDAQADGPISEREAFEAVSRPGPDGTLPTPRDPAVLFGAVRAWRAHGENRVPTLHELLQERCALQPRLPEPVLDGAMREARGHATARRAGIAPGATVRLAAGALTACLRHAVEPNARERATPPHLTVRDNGALFDRGDQPFEVRIGKCRAESLQSATRVQRTPIRER